MIAVVILLHIGQISPHEKKLRFLGSNLAGGQDWDRHKSSESPIQAGDFWGSFLVDGAVQPPEFLD